MQFNPYSIITSELKTKPKSNNELVLEHRTEKIKELFKIPSHPRNLQINELIYFLSENRVFVNLNHKDNRYELEKDKYFNIEKILEKIKKNILIFSNEKYYWVDFENDLTINVDVNVNKIINNSEITYFYNTTQLNAFGIEYDIVTTKTVLVIYKEDPKNRIEMKMKITFK